MCGIAGISLNPKDTTFDTRLAAVALLRGIESRGPDATGAAWYDPGQEVVRLTKIAVNATRFIPAREENLPREAPTMVLHTRYGTHGSKHDRGNNHPIHYGNIVGVHNGVLSNHTQLFKELGLKPNAEVDSEGLMALIHASAQPHKKFQKIRGDAAVSWIDLREPEVLHIARISDRPVHLVQTKGGTVLFASTKAAVDLALDAVGAEADFRWDMDEETYITVRGGVITSRNAIPGIVRSYGWAQQYAYTSGAGAKSSAEASAKGTAAPKAETAKAAAPAEDATPAFSDAEAAAKWDTYRDEWYDSMGTDQLVAFAQRSSVSQFAVDALHRRGLDRWGKAVKAEGGAKDVHDLVDAAREGSASASYDLFKDHSWSLEQLRALRGKEEVRTVGDSSGTYATGRHSNWKATRSYDEWVASAYSGSNAAWSYLRACGFVDRATGELLFKPALAEAAEHSVD